MNRYNLSEISYDDLKADLIAYLQTKDELKDINFEGSNISYLIDMLTYSTYKANAYNAFALNEAFLDTAVLRSSIISHGVQHGYTPVSSISASMIVNIGLDLTKIQLAGLPVPEFWYIDAKSTFPTKISETNFIFTNLTPAALYLDGNTFEYEGLVLNEGLNTNISTTYSLSPVIKLPDGVDTNTLKVYVDGEEWVYAENAIFIEKNTKVYFIRETSTGNFEIRFGDGNTSSKPENLSTISIDFLVCSEERANAGKAIPQIEFNGSVIIDEVDYTEYLYIDITSTPNNGSGKEDTESVRNNVINKSITQDRAITVSDYKYIILQKFGNIVEDAISWDLNDLSAPTVEDLGKVYVSMKPEYFRTIPTLTDTHRRFIQQEMTKRYMIGGVELEIVTPYYIGVSHTFDVYYRELDLQTNLTDLQQKIKVAVRELYDDGLVSFDSYLPVSRIQSKVDSVEDSILSSNVHIQCTLYYSLESGVDFQSVKNIGNSIVPGSVESNLFNIYDVDNLDGTGALMSDLGEIGSISYESGSILVEIPGVDIAQDSSLEITASPETGYIKSQFQQLIIDTDNVSFNFIKV
jgi:hypothetical protein